MTTYLKFSDGLGDHVQLASVLQGLPDVKVQCRPEYAELFEQAEKVFESGYKQRLERKRPYHEAATHEQALGWALNEYSEYGIYWIDEADS